MAANLPSDIVDDVFLRLPATTLLRFRALSKPFFSLIDSPDFIASHLKRTLETEDHLMILLRSPRILRTVYLDAPDKISDVEHPLQTDGSTELFGSVNGVVGLTNSPFDLAIFNPSTRKIHRLPVAPLDFPERSITRENVFYGLGHDSVSDDYKVARMIQSKDRVDESYGYPFEVKVFSLKTNKWKRIDLLPEDVEILFDNFYFQPLFRHGKRCIGFNTILTFDLATEVVRILSFPHVVYCRGMDIGALDGCLCMMCYGELSQVDIWIMREYGGKWSKFVSVPKPETVDSFKFVRPLIYSKDRSKILLEINNGKLFWFDLASKSFEKFRINVSEGLQLNAEIVVSSLVLGCKGDPRRAREKKMLQKGNKRRDDFLSKGFKLKL
ncbi:hypothetical protein Bca52824_005034 [Brassica carinata]|uniref:F-box domain-containing protein n=1 Tax=Brassica carinata TaxID=52824 RepID=A0A8X7WMS4_BRACI|nr:hypothetical protein Bca52824_005034 [Brassica carinata]